MKAEKKRVSIIISTLRGGGAERVAGLLSANLSGYYEVFLFVYNSDDVVYKYGGELVPFDDSKFDKRLTVESRLRHLKRKYGINISISFLDSMNIANIRSYSGEHIIISSRCSYGAWVPKDSLFYREIEKYYRYADSVVACSFGISQELSTVFFVPRDRIRTIYNYVDKENIIELSEEALGREFKRFIGDNEYFISIGRLVDQKNQMLLIKEYKKFISECAYDIKLVIIGDGNLKEVLEEEIRNMSLSDRVLILPYSDNPFRYLKGAKALIVASKYEGFPNVIMEAFSLGVPVIAADCMSGPREILTGEKDYSKELPLFYTTTRGILVGIVGDELNTFNGGLSHAMRWMCENRKAVRGIKKEIFDYIEDYSNETINKQWIEVIEDCGKDVSAIKEYLKAETELLVNAKNIFIYGAGHFAERVFNDYSRRCDISGFLVTNKNEDNQFFLGKEVVTADSIENVDDTTIIIGVSQKYKEEVYGLLREYGFKRVIIPY